jgi:HD-like signal output (HDOD) protein
MDTVSPDKSGQNLNAQRFQMLEDIARELAGEVAFPTSFDLVTRLRKALQDPNYSLDQIAALLALEPLISARLISLANSAAYNTSGQEVRDVKKAVSRLGLNNVRSAAMAIAMNQLLRSKDMVAFDEVAKKLWQHSLHTASAAYVLAKNLTKLNPDEAMLAGMVHDLGGFYMLYRATQYAELRTRPDSVTYVIAQWHESIGHSLLLALGLPEEVADAMRDHDQPRDLPEVPRNLADIIYVANLLAGGARGWLLQGVECSVVDNLDFGETYTALIPAIDAHRQEILAAYS